MKESAKHKYKPIALLIALLALAAFAKGVLTSSVPQSRIKRGKEAEDDRQIVMLAKTKEGEEEISFTVSGRKYTENELDRIREDFDKELEAAILGDNKSFSEITSSVRLPDTLPDYPFEIEYDMIPDGVFSLRGEIEEGLTFPVSGELHAKITYDGYRSERVIPFTVVSSEEKLFTKDLLEAIKKADEESLEEDYFILPKEVDGREVSFQTKRKLSDFIPLLFIPIAGVIFFRGGEIDRMEKNKKRKMQFKEAYPELAMNISMLIQAGFTPRGSLERIGKKYLSQCARQDRRTNPLYDEVIVTLREMGSGVPEKSAYEKFANRCNLPEISRLCSLMIRNIKRGSENLGAEIRAEGQRAVTAKRELIRKKAETASTKLLFPMMLFLLVVMVMILYPAFQSFSSF
ncbi:MAG: type II secretion system F family protein [Lachnospiraceae bacterium]|nr:type II secretion system F family protein [Lachnospiraceae bacterium]